MTDATGAGTGRASVPGSFRDPSGFLFTRDGCLYRQINARYSDDYGQLMASGLYERLVARGLLVPHEEVEESGVPSPEPVVPDPGLGTADLPRPPTAFRVIKPQPIPFISYPYEWCFSALKDAALATLAIQKAALEHDMWLKDASAYNIQFRDGSPILIDTLSFERYVDGRPWVAYRQFCQHFLGPLALMAYTDVRLTGLFRSHVDGIPLDLVRQLLPRRTRFRLSLLTHIHLHAMSQKRYADRQPKMSKRRMSRFALRALVDSLETAVRRLRWRPEGTEWADYYDQTNYGSEGIGHKERLVGEFLDRLSPRTVWDLGANVGPFSRIAAGMGPRSMVHGPPAPEYRRPKTVNLVVAMDSDPAAVERLYLDLKGPGSTVIGGGSPGAGGPKTEDRGPEAPASSRILPLLVDLTNPSPAIGWDHRERLSLEERGPADALLALGLIHHLAISNNVPLPRVAEWLGRLGRSLVIEFVPKHDSQVARLLATREDIFDDYHEAAFRDAFAPGFAVESRQPIPGTERVLYLMRRR